MPHKAFFAYGPDVVRGEHPRGFYALRCGILPTPMVDGTQSVTRGGIGSVSDVVAIEVVDP